ncbi:MAG: antibiotic biosynthesis monooxygenase [Trueperaceae bacterium]|nr:antibiotic biosynthesis monooxygenase [Trueperaceae bacterium]
MSQAKPKSFSVYASFTAKPGQYEAMKEIMQTSCDLNKGTPGLLQMVCLEPPRQDKPFVFVSIWESRNAFHAFLKTDRMKAFHSAKAIRELQAQAMGQSSAEFYSVFDVWQPELQTA